MSNNLKSLMGRLNSLTRGSLEASAGLSISRTNYEVEIEHWLIKLLDQNDSDLRRILRHFGIDGSALMRDLVKTVERLKTGNSRKPTLSPSLLNLAEEAWIVASIDLNETQIRSGHLLAALLGKAALVRQARSTSALFDSIHPETLLEKFQDITAGSIEEVAAPQTTGPAGAESAPHAAEAGGEGTALDKYTQDLTGLARLGKIDPIVGRETEVRQMVDILMRRRQNNPILTGEAGVGKTAVVEGLAHQIVAGDVPPPLKNVSIRSLDLGLLQAGAGVKGEFENRLKSVIQEVKSSAKPIIVFIDEAHTLIGAGGSAGQGDAANLLKPALARGELRTIAATTWSEYKKYFEKDAALTRRFQVVKVDEPDEEKAIVMMRGVARRLENHHKVRISARAVEDAVRLSHRYLTGRQLPDKSVSVLDTACARVAVSQCATPASIEDCQRRLDALEMEFQALSQEMQEGVNHEARLESLKREKEAVATQRGVLEARWKEELHLVQLRQQTLARLRGELLGSGPAESMTLTPDQRSQLQAELRQQDADLARIQGDNPLVHPMVDSNAVAEVIGGWTGIPVGRMLKDELETVRQLKSILSRRVIGQDHALEAIAQRIQTSRAGMDDPQRPIGVFLLAGTSGVGKTETALALAETLYGGERNLITINMSEYQEKHTVSTLKGAPPGYVGYGEGGVLTEAVRRKPYSVVLLDEIEKAHHDVLELFYQVFDKGWMEDGEGREIDFRNTVIILTTNLGTNAIMHATQGGKERPALTSMEDTLRADLSRHLAPAFIGRVAPIPYYPLADEQLVEIVRLKLGKIVRRGAAQGIEVVYSDDVVHEIVQRCTEVDTGARNIDHILTRTLLPEISREVLAGLATGKQIQRLEVRKHATGEFEYVLTQSEAGATPL